MSRKEFYKLYYTITNRKFSDHVIWTNEDREQAWRKGQINLSKIERKISIGLQYVALLAAIISFWVGEYAVGVATGVLFLLGSALTDFSVVKIEVLYAVYRRKNAFSALLYMVFRSGLDEFWSFVKPRVGKKVSGFVPEWKCKLWAKYSVIYRKQRVKSVIWLYPNKIVVKTENGKHTITDRTLSMQELADRVAVILIST
jgi:hypothetical protein